MTAEKRACATCGHSHRTMASVWNSIDGTRWYCHENDHSCYSQRNYSSSTPFSPSTPTKRSNTMSNLDIIREKLDGGKFTDLQELAEGLLCALESIEHDIYLQSPYGEYVDPSRIMDKLAFYTDEFATVPETCAHETYAATLETPAEGCEEDAVEGSEYCEEHSA